MGKFHTVKVCDRNIHPKICGVFVFMGKNTSHIDQRSHFSEGNVFVQTTGLALYDSTNSDVATARCKNCQVEENCSYTQLTSRLGGHYQSSRLSWRLFATQHHASADIDGSRWIG